MTAIRRQTVFAGLDRPQAWPALRGRPRPEQLAASLDTLPGVGPTVKRRLAKLGLETIRDLIEDAPFRYVEPATIASLFGEGEEVAIDVTVKSVSVRKPRRRLTIVEAAVADSSGRMKATWFNQPWVADQLHEGVRVRLIGSVRKGSFAVRSHELDPQPAALVGIYSASEEITPKKIRELVTAALPHVTDYWDPLPAELRAREGLPLRSDALAAVHQPQTHAEAETGRRRLAFDELLLLQIGIARRAAERERSIAPGLGEPGDLIARYRKSLPFALTPYQEQAIREIDEDLARTVPMQRLLQGDVGSGKTVVALLRAAARGRERRQGALMAPTEPLAEQHFFTVADLCLELGVTCELLTSALPARQHADVRARLRSGEATARRRHARADPQEVEFAALGLVVIDEQHRFGVAAARKPATGRRAGRAAPART